MIRRYFGIIGLMVVVLVLSGGFVSAQTNTTTTPSSTAPSFTISYPDFANPSKTQNPASFMQNLYTYALGISGVLAVIMIVYGGVKYVVSAGNASALSDALDIIKNAVWGIVLLAGAYLILNTINPEITALKNPVLEPIPDVVDEVDVGDDPNMLNLRILALELIGNGANIGVSFSGNMDDCGFGTSANANINDVSQGKFPTICTNSCGCVPGGASGTTTLSESMLRGILTTAEDFPTSFVVTSLAGGKHREGSAHYQGRAADFVMTTNNNPDDWNALVDMLKANGADSENTFCELGGKVVCSQLFDEQGMRIFGAHIHAEW